MKKVLIVALMLCTPLLMPELHAEEPGISVNASGSVNVRPDMAVFRAVVQSSDKDARKASAKTAETWAELQKALRSAGIPVDDSPSAGYTVSPEWVWDKPSGRNVLKGYVARHVVRVTVRDLRLIGAAVDAAVQAGVGDVQEIQFSSSRQEALKREALDLAVRKARTDAEVMANAAGGRLGTLLELASDAQSYPVMRQDAMMLRAAPMAAPATEIAPAEEEVSVTVRSRWRFIGPTGK
ncbi:MAG: SIMPL domain-containing protein [Chlorobiaceae bacterium]|nr:SIMPL domain-containing protein [Chlorobiaceae bacterium]